MSKDDIWASISATADKVAGTPPVVVPCAGCGQKNRVSPMRNVIQVPRCGKCGNQLPAPRVR